MIRLLPRLSSVAVNGLLDAQEEGQPPRPLTSTTHALPDATVYASSGGSRVEMSELIALRDGVVEIAQRHGFPGTRQQGRLAQFDAEAAAWLAGCETLASAEAQRDDVWAFIATALLPDVTHWRYGLARGRYEGGVRNTFQRLWMRAQALDRGVGHADRWGLLGALSEDALVQITERPAIGGDPVLARALAEGWARAAGRFGAGKMEDLMRRAVLRLRMINEFRMLSLSPSDELTTLVDELFEKAAAAAGVQSVSARQLGMDASAAEREPELATAAAGSEKRSSISRILSPIFRAR